MNFIGKIEWLRIDGRPREVREFETVEQLNEKADEQLEMGAPISIVLYTVEGKFPDFRLLRAQKPLQASAPK